MNEVLDTRVKFYEFFSLIKKEERGPLLKQFKSQWIKDENPDEKEHWIQLTFGDPWYGQDNTDFNFGHHNTIDVFRLIYEMISDPQEKLKYLQAVMTNMWSEIMVKNSLVFSDKVKAWEEVFSIIHTNEDNERNSRFADRVHNELIKRIENFNDLRAYISTSTLQTKINELIASDQVKNIINHSDDLKEISNLLNAEQRQSLFKTCAEQLPSFLIDAMRSTDAGFTTSLLENAIKQKLDFNFLIERFQQMNSSEQACVLKSIRRLNLDCDSHSKKQTLFHHDYSLNSSDTPRRELEAFIKIMNDCENSPEIFVRTFSRGAHSGLESLPPEFQTSPGRRG